VTPCSLVKKSINDSERPAPPFSDSSFLKIERAYFSKMLVVIYRITQVLNIKIAE